MIADGTTAVLLSAILLAVVGLEAPTVWFGLFLGVLAGLLLVAYVAGRQFGETDSKEPTQSDQARDVENDGGTTSTDSPGGTRGTGGVIDDDHSRTNTMASTERRGGNVARTKAKEDRDLDDGDRLVALLEEYDGQLRQSRIVAETDWSKTKVSRTLSRLDEEDEVVKIQLGRENLICLPGDVPSIGRERDT